MDTRELYMCSVVERHIDYRALPPTTGCILPCMCAPASGRARGRAAARQGFRVQGSGFRVQGSGFGVQGLGFRVQGLGCKVQA